MNVKVKKVLAIICALVLLFATVGCSGKGDTNSSSLDSGETLSGVDTNPNADNQQGSGTSNDSSNTVVNPEDYRGKTIKFATWSSWKVDVDGPVVAAFEKKYGIKVEWMNVPQDKYVTTIQSYIASGNPPDIIFDNGEFPSTLSLLQPVSAAKIDLSDPIWDQTFIKNATFNGKTYEVATVGNYWNERLCVYYNKTLFRNYNIKTPEEYYAEGNWTWATMEAIMKEFKAKETRAGYYGQVINWAPNYHATLGTGAYYFKNGKIVTGINDPLYIQSTIKLAEWNKAGYITDDRDAFLEGKAAMAFCEAFGLRKNGYWKGMNGSNIGFAYAPDWNASTKAQAAGTWRGWGICKGAKNPVAAGLFLKFYLDVNNYDIDTAFISDDAREFFFKLCGNSSEEGKQYYLETGVGKVVGEGAEIYHKIIFEDPNQIQTKVSSLKNKVNNNLKKVDKLFNEYTK